MLVLGSRDNVRAVRRHPESFQRYLDEFGPVSFDAMQRRPDFIASSVFQDRFGEEMLLVLYHPELVEKYRVPPKQAEAEQTARAENLPE